jgi:hypothetical protein
MTVRGVVGSGGQAAPPDAKSALNVPSPKNVSLPAVPRTLCMTWAGPIVRRGASVDGVRGNHSFQFLQSPPAVEWVLPTGGRMTAGGGLSHRQQPDLNCPFPSHQRLTLAPRHVALRRYLDGCPPTGWSRARRGWYRR